jgi:hypothetical protein
MKKGRNLYLVFKYIVIATFCSAIYVNSYSEPCHCQIELSSSADSIEKSLIPDLNFSDEDPMEESEISSLNELHNSQNFVLFLMPEYNNIFDPVWQPPKVF